MITSCSCLHLVLYHLRLSKVYEYCLELHLPLNELLKEILFAEISQSDFISFNIDHEVASVCVSVNEGLSLKSFKSLENIFKHSDEQTMELWRRQEFVLLYELIKIAKRDAIDFVKDHVTCGTINLRINDLGTARLVA